MKPERGKRTFFRHIGDLVKNPPGKEGQMVVLGLFGRWQDRTTFVARSSLVLLCLLP